MFTIQDYIDSLNRDKESLVANLTTKGISASDTETFTTLVPKVLDIVDVNNQSKSATITSNTTTTITPDEGYTGLSSVEVTTNVEADMSDYFTDTISQGWNQYGYIIKMIKKLPNNISVSGTSLQNAFVGASNLTEIPLMDTSNVTNMHTMCYSSGIVSFPQLNTSSVTDMGGMCQSCPNLVNLPLLDTSSVTNMKYICFGSLGLSDASLDNLLQMAANVNAGYTQTKTLADLLGTYTNNYPASRIQALPHYQDFLDAGWTIGY